MAAVPTVPILFMYSMDFYPDFQPESPKGAHIKLKMCKCNNEKSKPKTIHPKSNYYKLEVPIEMAEGHNKNKLNQTPLQIGKTIQWGS